MKTTQTHVLIIIYALAAHAIAALIGLELLAFFRPDSAAISVVATQGGLSLGAIAAILSKTERTATPTAENPAPVQVVDTENAPLHTIEDDKGESK